MLRTRSRRPVQHPDFARMAAERKAISKELKHSGLSPNDQKTLCECYIQHNTIASAAYKLDMKPELVHVWYYRMSLCDVQDSFSSLLNEEI